VEIVPEADHIYTGVQSELIKRLEAWLREKFAM
jgi:hypothetical protein